MISPRALRRATRDLSAFLRSGNESSTYRETEGEGTLVKTIRYDRTNRQVTVTRPGEAKPEERPEQRPTPQY